MQASRWSVSALCLFLIFGLGSSGSQGAAQTGSEQDATKEAKEVDILKSIVGKWEGNCKTWFQPGKLADESKVSGEFKPILGGRFVRHTYKGSMKGKPRTGEETIIFNPAKDKFQISWFDDFHMSQGLLFSEGEKTEKGFSVAGQYATAPGQKPWSWRTDFEMTDDDHLTITAYNIMPDGQEGKAVETVYVRKGKSS